MPHPHRRVFAPIFSPAAALALLLSAPAGAQCTNPWSNVPGSAGVEGTVSDLLVFDPDGAGPLGDHVLVAGSFEVAGRVFAQNLAVYEPVSRTWSPFGPGPYPRNAKLALDANGDLYLAGSFPSVAGVAAENVARWDGTAWLALGSGLGSSSSSTAVQHIAALPGGGVVVTGSITSAGGAPAKGIASWNGTSWSSLGATTLSGTVTFGSVVAAPNGDLYASVQQIDVTNFVGVQRYDGATWSPLGALGGIGGAPRKLLLGPSGELFASAGGSVARWTGAVWAPLGNAPLDVWDLGMLPNGLLVAVGRQGFASDNAAALWDGLTWQTIGTTNWSVSGATPNLAVLDDELLVGGGFNWFGGVAQGRLARWNGSTWSAASPGLSGSTRWLTVAPGGEIFAGAAAGAGGGDVVQRWTGIGWAPMGGGYPVSYGAQDVLQSLYAAPSGRLVSGGQVDATTTAAPVVRQWNGSSWTTLAETTSGTVHAIVELPNGDLVVGGQFTQLSGTAANNVARFDGTAWSPLSVGLLQTVNALATDPAGDLYALAGVGVFRWTGAGWTQIGLSLGAVRALVFDRGGAPIVAGDFGTSSVRRWNGVTWAPLGSTDGAVQSLAVLANGDLVAGPVASTAAPRSLQRWDGVSWSPLGGTVDGTVWSLALAANGDLLLSGDFAVADGVPRARFARVSTSCPASVVTVPSGCGTTATLSTRTLPWIGGFCRTNAAGLFNVPLAVVATGVQGTALPLGPLLSLPASSCQLLVVPILQDVVLPVNNTVSAQFLVPDSTALIGTNLHQQLIGLRIDSGGSLTSATATNALVFTVGSF